MVLKATFTNIQLPFTFTSCHVVTGDPLQYHSRFAVSVIDMDDPINPIDIIREGRMSTVVKKTKLFCSWDKDKDEVEYVSIQWAGK